MSPGGPPPPIIPRPMPRPIPRPGPRPGPPPPGPPPPGPPPGWASTHADNNNTRPSERAKESVIRAPGKNSWEEQVSNSPAGRGGKASRGGRRSEPALQHPVPVPHGQQVTRQQPHAPDTVSNMKMAGRQRPRGTRFRPRDSGRSQTWPRPESPPQTSFAARGRAAAAQSVAPKTAPQFLPAQTTR